MCSPLLQHGRCGRRAQEDCGCTLLEREGGEKLASVVSLQSQEECDLECVVPGGPAACGWQLCKFLVTVMETQAQEGSRNRLTKADSGQIAEPLFLCNSGDP